MNIYLKEFKHMFKRFVLDDKNKSTFVKWKQSIIAVVVALTLTLVLILFTGNNPLKIFSDIIRGTTITNESLQQTCIYFAMFLLAGTSIIIGFKSGLFNIGIGGQMLISGAVMMILGVQYNLPWFLLLIIGISVAAASAAISGVLKALFNIHEVVSTILINWILFWISQFLLKTGQPWMDGFGTTKALASSSRMMINDSIALPAILVSMGLLVLAIVFFRFTKWGFALKEVGENPNAAKYAGIKVVWQLAIGMALSGIGAGALASINYLGKFGTMSFAVSKSLPAIGFQGISVALISFNSLYGLIPAALFWAVITSGTDYSAIINPEVPKEILSLMNGFIIYSIAISIVFIRFKPITFIIKYITKIKSDKVKHEIEKYKNAIKKQKLLFNQNKEQVRGGFKINEFNNSLSKLKRELNLTNIELKKIKSNFINKNGHRSFLGLFLKKYRQKWDSKLFNIQSDILNKQEKIMFEMDKLLKSKLKVKISNLSKQESGGIKILKNEHSNRIRKLEQEFIKKTWIGKRFTTISISKQKSDNYLSQLAILKLERIRKINEIKKTTNDKKLINSLKNKYKTKVKNIVVDIEGKK